MIKKRLQRVIQIGEIIQSGKLNQIVPFRILIAEDVEMNMVLIKTLIKKIIPNVEIKEARNGMEAVHIYKQESP